MEAIFIMIFIIKKRPKNFGTKNISAVPPAFPRQVPGTLVCVVYDRRRHRLRTTRNAWLHLHRSEMKFQMHPYRCGLQPGTAALFWRICNLLCFFIAFYIQNYINILTYKLKKIKHKYNFYLKVQKKTQKKRNIYINVQKKILQWLIFIP